MSHRTLKLSHKEIELLETALNESYAKRLEIVRKERKTIGEATSNLIIDGANEFDDLRMSISNSEKDL